MQRLQAVDDPTNMTELEQLKQRVDHLEGVLNSFSKKDRFLFGKAIQFSDARNIQLGKTTGTQIGTEGGTSGQKLGFFGATPVVQRTGIAVSAGGIHAALVSLGLITA